MLKRCQDLFIRKIIAAFLLMVGFTTTNILGQPDMTAKLAPSDEEAAKKVDAFLSQWDKKDMPGGAVGVVKDGKLVYKRGFGMANLDYDVPNTPTTLFNLASTSKPSWYLNRSQSGFTGISFGESTDKPVPNAFIP